MKAMNSLRSISGASDLIWDTMKSFVGRSVSEMPNVWIKFS
jgi:hypothetical protein